MKILRAALATLVFLLLLLATYYAHVAFLAVDVVLYSALADAVIAAGISAALMLPSRPLRILNPFEKAQLVVIWLLAGFVFAISVPTVIDRSLSFYILEKLQQRGGGIRLDRFEEVFTQEYVKEHRLVAVRLTEQQQSGTIEIVGGCVKLTPRGRFVAEFSRYFRRHFLPRQRLLMGQYSDALTDPFRHSRDNVDYQCE